MPENQRSVWGRKIYRAQRIAKIEHMGNFRDPYEAQTMVNHILAAAWWPGPEAVLISYSSDWKTVPGSYLDDRAIGHIDLSAGRLDEGTVVHELSHLYNWRKTQHHGVYFVRAQLVILERVFATDIANDYRAALRAQKLRW